MHILAVETSCDETAAAIVEDGRTVHASIIASSRDVFMASGGVIPEQAARKQVECILPVISQALGMAKMTHDDIDALAVTRGPGLLGSLLVGTTAMRTLALLWSKPLIGVHHTLGHLSSTWLDATDELPFPSLTLSASGGHTELWYRESHLQGKLIGRTRDDAAGEAFDKGATLLGLPYPGGPNIAKHAATGDEHRFAFPLPLKNDDTLDFSYSGLKTTLRYILRDTPDLDIQGRHDLAASYQYALCAHLCDRLRKALELYPDTKEVHLVGGVSANTRLRELVCETVHPLALRVPPKLTYCTDNAAMIAAAAYFLHQENPAKALQPFDTVASLPLSAAI